MPRFKPFSNRLALAPLGGTQGATYNRLGSLQLANTTSCSYRSELLRLIAFTTTTSPAAVHSQQAAPTPAGADPSSASTTSSGVQVGTLQGALYGGRALVVCTSWRARSWPPWFPRLAGTGPSYELQEPQRQTFLTENP